MGAGPFAGSSDALALADLARRAAAQKRMVAVVSAEPRCGAAARRGSAVVRARASRGAAARLGDAALRPVLAAPGPRVRAARDALSRLARRMRRPDRRGDDGAVSARAAVVSRGVHVLPAPGRDARRRRAARAAFACRLLARDAGRLAGRVRRARRPHRSLSDGIGAAVPHRPLRQRDRDRSRRSTSTPSARSIRCATCACCRRASSRSTTRDARAFAAASAKCSKATRRSRRCTRT